MRDIGCPAESATGTEDGRALSIGIENFGPIAKGTINLKPLTLFVGPNGCGKSHAASLFYIMAKLEQADVDYFGSQLGIRRGHIERRIRDEATKIHERHKNGESTVYVDILKGIVEPKAEIENAIRKIFLVEPETVIQLGKKQAALNVKSQVSGNIRIKILPDGVSVDGISAPRIKIVFQNAGTDHVPSAGRSKEERVVDINIPAPGGVFDVYDELTRRLTRRSSQRSHAYYFPAERSGLTLASQTIIADALYRGRQYRLSSTATDYLAFLALLSEKESTFSTMSRAAEMEITHGQIVVTATSERRPAIHYRQNGHEFPLHLAASSVKDLAPFFLYLKNVADINDLVILEEPEISLHPESQMRLAKFIVRLVNQGLYVVATTHSPYFLEQISHCVKAGHMDSNGASGILPNEELLRPDKVAPYKFRRHDGGYTIQSMPVSADGIPQDEFMDVDGKLYDELSRLRRAEVE